MTKSYASTRSATSRSLAFSVRYLEKGLNALLRRALFNSRLVVSLSSFIAGIASLLTPSTLLACSFSETSGAGATCFCSRSAIRSIIFERISFFCVFVKASVPPICECSLYSVSSSTFSSAVNPGYFCTYSASARSLNCWTNAGSAFWFLSASYSASYTLPRSSPSSAFCERVLSGVVDTPRAASASFSVTGVVVVSVGGVGWRTIAPSG